MAVKRSRGLLWMALLVVASCDSPRPSPSPGPTGAASPAAVESTGPTLVPTPAASPIPSPPTAVDLINSAVEAGTISEATGYQYRFYAQWGDPRLPEAFQGPRTEDLALDAGVTAAFDGLSEADQSLLRPFVVRPTHADSYWATAPAPAAATTGTARLAAVLTDDPRCGGGEWARRDLVTAPVTIWAHCQVDASGSRQLRIGDALARADAIMTRMWGRMTRLMGVPMPDRYQSTVQSLFEVDEAGDGRVDLYLVEAPGVIYDRAVQLPTRAAGVARPTPRGRDGATPAYMVVDAAGVSGAFGLETVIVHEFFHVLAMSHEYEGVKACPYPALALGCAEGDLSFHWFMEASAAWAEHEFLPEGRAGSAYRLFDNFLAAGVSLADTGDDNEYDSFMWPLFMEQESPLGPAAIADAWTAIERASGWTAVQAAVDAQQPFSTTFRDFAVRVWNEEMLPGDPISRRFNAPSLDPSFPTTRPTQVLQPSRWKGEVDLELGVMRRETIELPEMWAAYYRVNPPPGAGRLTLNFAGLQPNGPLDVDALVMIRNVGWERRMLDPTVTEWCLDRPADAIEEILLVLSNHSQTPEQHVKGDWTAQAEAGGCAVVSSDGLVWTFFSETGSPDSFYQSRHESLTLRVSLKPGPNGFGFVDDGTSTWRGGIDTEAFIAGLPGSGCDLVGEGHGGGGGPIPVDNGGGLSATLTEDVTPPAPGSSAPPLRRWILTIGASIPIELTTTETSCIGSGSSTTFDVIQLQDCGGTEVEDTATGLLFDFNCVFEGVGYRWSLVGKVRLAT